MATSCSCGTCPSCLQTCENGPVETIKEGSFVRVSDRNGLPKNLKNKAASIVTVDESGARNSDGSVTDPLLLNLQEMAQAASVTVVATDGVIGKMTPDETLGITLIFGFKDGVLGFFDATDDPYEFSSARLGEIEAGEILGLECSANGKVRLAKLLLNCTGIRGVVVEGGRIRCADQEIDECPAVSDEEELDSIWGCFEGKWTPILPVEGRRLIGVAGPKWALEDESIEGFATPRYFIGQKRSGYTGTPSVVGIVDTPGTSGLASGTFNMATISNYTTGASVVYVRATTAVENITGANEAKAQVKINGEVIAESWMDTAFQYGYRDSVVYPVKITSDAFTFELVADAATSTVWAWAKLEVVSWR